MEAPTTPASEDQHVIQPQYRNPPQSTPERMLERAEKRSRQAQKIVEKWKARLADLDIEGVAVKQARLWQDENSTQATLEEW